jgi:hypothetical protein
VDCTQNQLGLSMRYDFCLEEALLLLLLLLTPSPSTNARRSMVGHQVMIRLIGSEASALSSACTRRNGGMVFRPGGPCTKTAQNPRQTDFELLGPASGPKCSQRLLAISAREGEGEGEKNPGILVHGRPIGHGLDTWALDPHSVEQIAAARCEK